MRRLAAAALVSLLASSPIDAAEKIGRARTWATDRLATAVADVEPILQRWGYPAVAVAASLDNVGVPVPADTIVVAATLTSLQGDLRLPLVIALAILGSIVGSQLGYGIGRRGGRALLRRLPLSPERVAAVERRYDRWGVWVVVLAPFIEGVRQLNAFTAGMLGLAWWRFTLANVAATLLWATVWIGATWLVDEHVGAVLPVLRAAKPWLIAAALAGLGALLFRLRRRKAEPAATTSR